MKTKSTGTAEDGATIEVQEVANIPNEKDVKISNLEAMMHMIKSTIGGGFLAMPEAFSNAGLLVGSIGTLVLGISVLNMMSFIVRASQILRSPRYAIMILTDQNIDNDVAEDDHNKEPIDIKSNELVLEPFDFPQTVELVFKYGSRGRFASWAKLANKFTTISLIATYYGVNIIYVCVVASTTKQLVDLYTTGAEVGTWGYTFHDLNIRWYPLVVALLIIPMGMIRLIKLLVPFSMIANGLISVSAAVLFYFIFTDDGGRDPLRPEERSKLVVWPMTRWSLFAGSALCSMEGVGMLMHIENSMKKPRQLVGSPTYTLHWSMLIIVILNGFLGFFGYVRYGDRCLGSIPLNLPSDNRLSEAVKIVVTLGILMTYGLQLTVTADLVWQWLKRKTEPKMIIRIGSKKKETENMNLDYYIMRFILIIGTVIVATVVPDVGPMISLVGAVGFSVLGIIIPAAMETAWYWDPKSENDLENTLQGTNFDGETVEDGNGLASAAVLMSKVAKTDKDKRKMAIRRTIRHVKNSIYVVLALFALTGGAYYNLKEIFTPSHSMPAPDN